MANILQIGVLGCSSFAMRSMIPAIKSMPEQFNLIAIASRTEEKSKVCANKMGIKQSFDTYDKLLNFDCLDAVYIPLPNSLHFEWVKKALKHGLHVLVEKSMACSYEEVKYLNELACSRDRVLVENFQFRFHKQLAVIQNMVSDGIIGELRCIRSSFGFPPFPDTGNIRYKKELGGGALLDAGVYTIKVSQIFLGYDIEVSAANLWFDSDKDIDIWGGAFFKQKDGPIFSEVAFGFDNFYQCNLELWGSKGKITANRIFTSPPGVQAEVEIKTNDGKETIMVEPENHFKKILEHFFDLMIGNEKLDEEYVQNINQARLIRELKEKATEE